MSCPLLLAQCFKIFPQLRCIAGLPLLLTQQLKIYLQLSCRVTFTPSSIPLNWPSTLLPGYWSCCPRLFWAALLWATFLFCLHFGRSPLQFGVCSISLQVLVSSSLLTCRNLEVPPPFFPSQPLATRISEPNGDKDL